MTSRSIGIDDRPQEWSSLGRSVWLTGTTDLAAQLGARGYHPATAHRDPGVIPPAIAAHAIAAFTAPGGLVLDPDCGAGTTLVEALRAGRHAIGLTATRPARKWARANISAAKAAGATADGMVLAANRQPATLAAAALAGVTGRVDLLLTTLRPTATAAPTPRTGPTDIAEAVDRLARLLADSHALLRPGGHVVVTLPPSRSLYPPYALADLPGAVHTAVVAVGLVPVARCVALTVTLAQWRRVRGTRGLRHTMTEIRRATGRPVTRPGHHTVLVFAVTSAADALARALPLPPLTGPAHPGAAARITAAA